MALQLVTFDLHKIKVVVVVWIGNQCNSISRFSYIQKCNTESNRCVHVVRMHKHGILICNELIGRLLVITTFEYFLMESSVYIVSRLVMTNIIQRIHHTRHLQSYIIILVLSRSWLIQKRLPVSNPFRYIVVNMKNITQIAW